jgi:hypothetical protein
MHGHMNFKFSENNIYKVKKYEMTIMKAKFIGHFFWAVSFVDW